MTGVSSLRPQPACGSLPPEDAPALRHGRGEAERHGVRQRVEKPRKQLPVAKVSTAGATDGARGTSDLSEP